jgi:hypothetical protein
LPEWQLGLWEHVIPLANAEDESTRATLTAAAKIRILFNAILSPYAISVQQLSREHVKPIVVHKLLLPNPPKG